MHNPKTAKKNTAARTWKERIVTPAALRGPKEKSMETVTSPVKAIRQKCLDCAGNSAKEVVNAWSRGAPSTRSGLERIHFTVHAV